MTKQGTWPIDCVQRAFVDGAAWWEFQSADATMWQSDRDRAEAEAVRRFGEPDSESPISPPPSETRDLALLRIYGTFRRNVLKAYHKGDWEAVSIALGAFNTSCDTLPPLDEPKVIQSSAPPSETKLSEAIEPKSFTLGDLRRVGLRALWLSLREVERQQDETEGHGAIVARAISDLMAGDLIDGRDGAGYTALISPKCGEIGEVRALDAFTALLDAFEVAAVKRAWVRRAFHAGERWVDDGHASHPTESYLLDADNEARASRSSLESLYRETLDDLRLSEKAAETWRIACDQNAEALSALRSLQLTPEEARAIEDTIYGRYNKGYTPALERLRRISSKATSEDL